MSEQQRDHGARDAAAPGTRFVLLALCFGNFMIGAAMQAPAGMMAELAEAFARSYSAIGSLIWIGAFVVGLGAPVLAWATTRIDRGMLLAATLGCLALANVVIAMAPDFWVLIACRLVVTLCAGIFTPQAAAAAGMLVPPKQRIQAVTLVFVGWSLAAAGGTPLVKLMAAHFGWREATFVIALGSALAGWLVWRKVPRGLTGAPISFATWIAIARHPALLATLAVTLFSMAGIQAQIAYNVPFLAHGLGAGAGMVAILIALQGACGVGGTTLISRYGAGLRLGPGIAGAIGAMLAGFCILALAGDRLVPTMAGLMLLGTGIFTSNSLQQARLIALAPAMGSASVALNTSVVHLGMGAGAYAGGLVVARDLADAPWAAAALMAVAFAGALAMIRIPR
jgi:predicted MFS family arabinose efflux permease